jgi:hypothetical protein
MDNEQIKMKSTLHPYYFLADNIIFIPKMATAMQGRCGLVKIISHLRVVM